MNLFLYLVAVFLFALTLFFIGYLFYAYFILSQWGKYPPYFPSFGAMKKIAAREADIILSQSPNPLQVADLGCGAGVSLSRLATRFPQHCFTGYEWDFLLNFIGRLFRKKPANLQVRNRDFMAEDLSRYNLILCFLSNEIAPELSAKLQKELSPGSIVISSAFMLPGLQSVRQISAKTYGFMPIKVFIYRI